MNQVVIQKYPEPSTDVEYNLLAGGTTTNPYAGMDRFGRVVDLQWKQGATELVRLKYGYDLGGNRTYRRDEVARANGAGFDQLYGYDGLNRLTSMNQGTLNNDNDAISGSPTLTQGWTLDETGNWSGFNQTVQNDLTQTRTHNTVNEITDINKTLGIDWADPVHDANGNMTTIPQPKSLGDSYAATWDAWNRLVKLKDGTNTVAEYEYDGLNRRITKTVPTLLGSVTHHAYFSDQWQVLEERIGSNSFADQQFVWGMRYVDDLVLRDRFDVGPGYDNRLYALQDALFNVVALADNTGAVKERFAYQPYGESESLDPDFASYSGTDYQWEYRFTGRELDLESGLQINRMRYLHLQLGRWVNRDPIGYHDGSNLYSYVRSSPMKHSDPQGLMLTPSKIGCEAFLHDLGSVVGIPGVPKDISKRLSQYGTYLFCGNCGAFENYTWKVRGGCNVCLNGTREMYPDQWVAILIHELTHCEQFKCPLRRGGKPIVGHPIAIPPPPPVRPGACKACKKQEGEAYERQCRFLHASKTTQLACVNAGKCYSCQKSCENDPAFKKNCKAKEFPRYYPEPYPNQGDA